MVVKNMRSYITDELVNKIHHLNVALIQAKEIIKKLEQENESLKIAFSDLQHNDQIKPLATV